MITNKQLNYLCILFTICFLSTSKKIYSQASCSLGNPVFTENFGSGVARLGPSLNQDPNADVHPNFRPAQLYTYIGGNGTVGYDQYGLMKNPYDAAPGGATWNNSFTDHTGNTNGYMYYCDAGTDLNVFYAQKIDGLCNDIEYELSAWFAKSNEPGYFIDPDIKLIVGFTDANDIPLGNIIEANTGSISGIGANRWHQKTLVFTVPSGTENIYFMLKNNVSGQAGNDLAIDDIEVRPCGPLIDIKDAANNVTNNESHCLNGTVDNNISLNAEIPNNFVMIWQESTTPGVWTDLPNETSNTLNYTISASSNPFHHFRLKFAHNANNLLNSSCNFFSDPILYYFTNANTAPNLELCDDDNDGEMTFDLTQQNNLISSNPDVTITYYNSLNDAQTGPSYIATPNNFLSTNTTIYARVENNYNPDCFSISTFKLEVYPSPFPLNSNSINPIQECDDASVGTDTDGFKITDITQRANDILNGQPATDFTLTYFTDGLYVNEILNPTTFINTISGGQTIYVRMSNNNKSECYADTNFILDIPELPTVMAPGIYAQCDDASNDGIALFNLTLNEIKTEINPNFMAEGLTFTYYNDPNEAELKGANIPSPESYQNSLAFSETIYIRVENPNTCYRVVPLQLQVNPSSSALDSYNPTAIHQCDDGADFRDGISTFNMSAIKSHISNTLFSSIPASVHFYESQNDAELEINEIINIDAHENTNSPNSQNIWVRIKSSLGNDCLGLKEFQNLLVVEPLPTANPVTIAAQCDFDISDNVLNFPFDISPIENIVLGTQDPNSVTVSYYDASGAMLPSPLPNPFLTETQTITIRVTNNVTQDPDGACYAETTLDFVVDQQPVAHPVASQIFCDDGSDGTAINDGLHTFDTSTFSNTILGNQSNMEIYFSYDDIDGNTITDATTLPNPLVSDSQTINVNVINPINTSCVATTTIDLVVNPIPEFYMNEEEIVCTSDPSFTVTLAPVQNNPSETFDYSWSFENGNEISNDKTLDVSTPGTYSITLTNPATLCSTTKSVIVKASELATITQDDITVVDISDHNSVTINNPASLGSGSYKYALESKDGLIIFPYQDQPVFNNVRAGDYTLFVKDDICGIAELDVFVIGYRKFFTPNGDGQNDYWKIQGLDQSQTTSMVYIYDRYGKLIKQLDPLGIGWDGTFKGKVLSSDDYWFKVQLTDGRTFMGHFTLKR
ncbi:T9SS type B sorting domain-containing protein [Aestuariibaculum sediminum]|uniref:T9SS type B sorting domain-containing protein n=1 Tax=Aestuariibaculum sediminum TaxID=2770637 RepID=A0A8J6Q908_9FLAO|nr:T9SS type B sorting domain-containing protein [Aestuariibaculum sediminum]MBD0832062.1 T9SS type B sorting domain-containing protein [Aestuariibaculum sediminum]